MKAKSRNNYIGVNVDLQQRWPDAVISQHFRKLLTLYEKLCVYHLRRSDSPTLAVRKGYQELCDLIVQSSPEAHPSGKKRAESPELAAVRDMRLAIRQKYESEWLQSVASLLAMLMHFTPAKRGPKLLVNERRPSGLSSTYPNSPALAKVVGQAVFTSLLKRKIPLVCHRLSEAERYAEQALDFRVMDPSMESGQLLLELALSAVRSVHDNHLASSKTARYLTEALVTKMCRDCLWGIDRNELAIIAVRALFSLLGQDLGLKELVPQHLLTADAFRCFESNSLSKFDAIANNPPWGERLKTNERKRLRKQFSTLQNWSDTYVAFSELAIQSLRSDGVFALILPSQVLAARNTSRLRGYFMSNTTIERMILLPRAAFADATVRGLLLVGRVRPSKAARSCLITEYPIVKRFDAIGKARSLSVRSSVLQSLGSESWLRALNPADLTNRPPPTLMLGEIAEVASGVKLYQKGAGEPPQTASVVKNHPFTLRASDRLGLPAISGRDVQDFHLRKPEQSVKFGCWLAWTGNHRNLRRTKRIFLRQICRRDGKITAAVAIDGFIPLHGVLTIFPRSVDVYLLTALLNSTTTAEYVRRYTASFSKVDFQRITITELKNMPIPVAAIGPAKCAILNLNRPNKRDLLLCERLSVLSRRASRIPRNGTVVQAQLQAEIDDVVRSMYGL